LERAHGLIQSWLIARIAGHTGIAADEIDTDERISRYGFGSLAATGLIAELGSTLGCALSPTLFWQHPTIEALARYLADDPAGARSRPVIKAAELFKPEPLLFDSPIAVVGMGCRFPGAPDPVAFWRLLRDGVDAITEIPAERWDVDAFYSSDLTAPGKMNTRRAGFLAAVDQFDPLFFSISPREASEIDPQQRLALEVCWEALEDAGTSADRLRGSRTGVFMGAIWHDYADLHRRAGAPITAHTGMGQTLDIIANRVSYVLGLQGPSIALDTACSSSLVAVHLACQSLRNDECSLALAGGVSLILAPDTMVQLSKFGGLSPDGSSKAFDARANGYGRGEGAGVVVLKLLSAALADGDPIYCVIRGSAVNNDGFSNGLSAPNPAAQESVLREAYRRSGVATHKVHYVEAHGTGTALGDPIEAQSLGAVLGGRAPGAPLLVGSVKTNIGHLEGAAGIAGLIKTALSIENRAIPPSLHYEQPNPYIPFKDLNISIPSALRPWPGEEPALAGVSSFGWGGTNCHIVLEGLRHGTAQLFLAAGDTRQELFAAAGEFRDLARDRANDFTLQELCRVAGRQGVRARHRLATVVRSHVELTKKLDLFLTGGSQPDLHVTDNPISSRKLVFVCSPHGSQWCGMGRDLLAGEPVFRAKVEQCDRALQRIAGWSIIQELTSDTLKLRMGDVAVVQPLLFTMQVALASLWRSWGIEPDAIVGHSLGEIAAAHISGALELEDAVQVIYHYSRLQASQAGRGGMAIVGLAPGEVVEFLAPHGDRLVVAAHNSANSTVLSGDSWLLKSILDVIEKRGIFCSLIDIDVAVHGPQMNPVLAELREKLATIHSHAPAIPMVSTVTAAPQTTACDGEYWARNLREPVLLSEAIARLIEDGCDLFVEVSPHPVLGYCVEHTLSRLGRNGVVLPSCRREEDERAVMLDTLASLYASGRPVRVEKLCRAGRESIVHESPVDDPKVEERFIARITDGSRRMRHDPLEPAEVERPLHVLCLSAKTPGALRQLAARFATFLRQQTHESLADVCYTANTGRSHFAHRLAAIGSSPTEIREGLAAFADGENPARVLTGSARLSIAPSITFLFPNLGCHYEGMARQLYDTQPAFRGVLDRCDWLASPYLDRPISSILYPEPGSDSLLGRPSYAQPALFAIEYALAGLWRTWGIDPQFVLGQGVGECTAACVAGIISLEEGLRLTAERGKLMEASLDKRVLAAVAAGLEPELEAATSYPEAASLDAFAQAVRETTFSPPGIGFVSGLLGRAASSEEITHPGFWLRHSRESTGTTAGFEFLRDQCLQNQGSKLFLEAGPSSTLSGAGSRCFSGREAIWLASLGEQPGDWQQLLLSLGTLYISGATVDWFGFDREYARQRLHVPTYPFQRSRHWFGSPEGNGDATLVTPALELPSESHPLLGHRLRSALQETLFEIQLSPESPSYLRHHQVHGKVVLPGAAYLEMARAGATEAYGAPAQLLEVVMQEPLVLPGGEPRTLQLILSEERSGAASFRIFSLDGDRDSKSPSWTLHVTGKIRVGHGGSDDRATTEDFSLSAVQNRCREAVPVSEHYGALRIAGLDYGASFQGLQRLWRGVGEALAQIRLPEDPTKATGWYAIHPVLVDTSLQVISVISTEASSGDESHVYLPFSLEEFRVSGTGVQPVWAHAVIRQDTGSLRDAITADVRMFDDAGQLIAVVMGLHLKRASAESMARSVQSGWEDWLYRMEWRPRPSTESHTPADYLPAASEIARRISPHFPSVASEDGLDRYEAALPSLDELATTYVSAALRQLGWQFRPGELVSAPSLANQLRVTQRHRRLFARVLEMLEEERILIREGSSWRISGMLSEKNPRQLLAETLERFPECETELAILGRCGERMADVLIGECDALQLLCPNGSLSMVERFYQNSTFSRALNRLAGEAVDAAVKLLPEGRPLRILEIGAGTGGATSYVLPRLPAEFTDYVFTDVSPIFTSHAEGRFRRDFPFVRYQLLDIERESAPEKADRERFDIVLAANVLHATSDLRQTLRNVRGLLAPAGLLVVLEVVRPQRWVDFVFGLTEGWWKFTDSDLRPSHPLLPVRRWGALLDEAGFVESASIPTLEDGADVQRQVVLLARNSADVAQLESREATAKVTREPGTWLIVADARAGAAGVGRKLAGLLEARNQHSIVVSTGDVDGADSVGFERLLQHRRGTASSFRGVVHLWSLDSTREHETTAATLERDQTRNCGSTLHLVQALAKAGGARAPRLWLVTRGAQPVEKDATSLALAQTPLWALGRVVANEHPELWGGLIDLDPNPTDADASNLLHEILNSHEDDHLAYRGGQRHVARLVRAGARKVPKKHFLFRGDASYLITGGLGGLGLTVARWMVSRGARNIVLVGRSAPSGDTLRVIDELERQAARIAVRQADVSREEDVAEVLHWIAGTLPPLKGIIHGAGILRDAALLQQDWTRFEQVMAPKISGAWNLHSLTLSTPLDIFVLFSSQASLLGSAGQGNHSAANAFLDALAHHRRAMGLPALSINWGAWEQVGAAAQANLSSHFARRGLGYIAPEKALSAFEYLLEQDLAQCAVMRVDWAKFARQFSGGKSPLYASLMRPASEPVKLAEPMKDRADFLLELTALEPAERHARLLGCVRDQAIRVLRFDPSERLDIDQPLIELGLDSLMAIELKNHIETDLGVVLPLPRILEGPSTVELTDQVMQQLHIESLLDSMHGEITNQAADRDWDVLKL